MSEVTLEYCDHCRRIVGPEEGRVRPHDGGIYHVPCAGSKIERLRAEWSAVRAKYIAAQDLVDEIREEIAAHLTVECEVWARPLLDHIDQRIATLLGGRDAQ